MEQSVSIVIATKFKQIEILENSLESIYKQEMDMSHVEVIVVDDNDDDLYIESLIDFFNGPYIIFKYIKNKHKCPCHNPGWARNVGYKASRGDIIICASDDIVLSSDQTLPNLLAQFSPEKLLVPHTINANCTFDPVTRCLTEYDYINTMVSPEFFPYMFFGLVARKHIYAVGGNDERFIHSGFEDRTFVEDLINHCNLKVEYSDELVIHQHHNKEYHNSCQECQNGNASGKLYWQLHGLKEQGKIPWTSSTGAWK